MTQLIITFKYRPGKGVGVSYAEMSGPTFDSTLEEKATMDALNREIAATMERGLKIDISPIRRRDENGEKLP